MNAPTQKTVSAQVHCPSCTHRVPGDVQYAGRHLKVLSGQKCPRCKSSLDAAAVLYVWQAA